MLKKYPLYKVWFIISSLAIIPWRVEAEIGFKYIPAWERMIDPIRQPPVMGFSSTLWDSLSLDTVAVDTALAVAAEVDSAKILIDDFQPDTTRAPAIYDKDFLPIDPLATGLTGLPGDSLIEPDDKIIKSGAGKDVEAEKQQKYFDEAEEDVGEEEEEPPAYHPTIIHKYNYQIEYEAAMDTLTNYIILYSKLEGGNLPISGAISPDLFIKRSIEQSDWESWRSSVLKKFPKKTEPRRGAVEIKIPVFPKGKFASRIFGGDEVGLSVTGDITINGGLKTEKRDQVLRDNQSNTNVAFKMDQTQRFHITGSVGEKVKVSIDQDSERLFEFENNLRISYRGNPDEILQTIDAGNVSLNLPNTALISGSARHQGLFGIKITSQVGPLKLTTIASLDKGEKQTKNIVGGAEKGGRTIDPKNFLSNQYFFLDEVFREAYRHFDPDLKHYTVQDREISRLTVYKSISAGEAEIYTRGWAHSDLNKLDTTGGTTQEHQFGLFIILKPDIDYSFSSQSGWLRLNQPLYSKDDILAVAYVSGNDTLGHLTPPALPDVLTIKLIRPKSAKPTDETWKLMWRHVYHLGATGINWEGFSGKIEGTINVENETLETFELPSGESLPFIDYRLFGLDYQGSSGEQGNPDGRIDQAFLRLPLGELHFPDLRPFDPEGWYLGPDESQLILNKIKDSDTTVFYPAIYDGESSALKKIITKFDIVVEYENMGATYDLGFLVLDGSEEVTLNGRRLSRGIDYTIDYTSGSLTILEREATVPGADLEIKWETGSLMSLDTKTILGMRAEYGLWDNSYVGATFMHRNQKTQDKRIRVGSEPVRNSIWDINAALVFKPYFLTRAVDWLPLIETNAESKFTIKGEVAQIYPNPNSLNSPSTGDFNGVAYVDDFESIKRSLPLGIMRKRWNHASFPEYDSRGESIWMHKRGRLIWYNPTGREKVKNIWPEKEVQTTDSETDVLKIEFKPYWTHWDSSIAGVDDQLKMRHWGGIMRYLGGGFADQTESKYIEIWLNRGSAVTGQMYIDIGQISEDVIPNHILDTEDLPETGYPYGNTLLDEGEDVGIDGIAGIDPSDLVDINGDSLLVPSYDDYVDRDDTRINGTENDKNRNRYPDTEDLDGDKYLDQTNSFFRYKIDFSEGDDNKYIAGGLSNTKGWRLYRIPLVDTFSINEASLNSIEYARLWFTGFRSKASIRIAQIDIVGNEWLEDELPGSDVEPLKVAVINTHDNPPPEYTPPPGVLGELDPVTNQRAKEQSLVLKIDNLNTGEIGSISKRINRGIDLLDYKFLKMFVHGGNFTEKLTDRMGRALNLDMFLRFGTDEDKNYYEYSQRLFPGWHANNEIVIDMERLSSIKFLREQDSLRDYDILPNGDVIRVVGNPKLGSIKVIVIGIKNHGRSIIAADNIEIWVDELRVSDVHRNPGWAARGSMALNLADLVDFSVSLHQSDANFHNVDKRRSPQGTRHSIKGNTNMSVHLDKFFNPQWGLRLPVSGHFKQEIHIPKFKPDSDILLSALGGDKVDAYAIYKEILTSNARFSDNPVYSSPSDSLISLHKSYSISTSYSKSRKSDNPYIHYTLDQFALGTISHSESYSSNVKSLYVKDITNKVLVSYKFPIDDPIKLNWLRWTENLPFLNRYSESELQPLPSSLTFNAGGEEKDHLDKKRSGTITERYTFRIDRAYNISWKPLRILGVNFGQRFDSEHHRDEQRRNAIALDQVNIDPEDFRVFADDDTVGVIDSLSYFEAVEQELVRVRDKIYWKLGGLHFIDQRLSQNFSTTFSPEILSWLTTDANYNSRYSWNWSQAFGPGDRNVNVGSNFSANLTFRLQSLMNAWDKKSGAEKTRPGPGGLGGNLYENQPYPDDPRNEFDRFTGDFPEPGKTLPEGESITKDEQTTGNTDQDSVAVSKPKPHPLAPLKFVLRRLKDIRYQYNLSNSPRNNSIEPGQASWKYRLGFTRDPGLKPVEGYDNVESNSRTDRHSISSGFDITDKLRLSNISYNLTITENSSSRSGKTGSNSATTWHYFESGNSTPKSFPIINYSASWSGLSDFAIVQKFANSINVNNSFRGSKSEGWQFYPNDSARTTTSISYDKSFEPLIGMSFNWKWGISSSANYSFNQRVEVDPQLNSKTRNVTESINFQSSYTSRRGFRVPLPIWPFKNRRFKNSTSFALSYQFSRDRRETAQSNEDFSEPNLSTRWSVSPSIDYSFSSTVKGGFEYEYGVRKTERLGKITTQDFSFRVNIAIRG